MRSKRTYLAILLGGALLGLVAPSAQVVNPGRPAGGNTQIQYNNNGVFGASADLTFNAVTQEVGLASSGGPSAFLYAASDGSPELDAGNGSVGYLYIDQASGLLSAYALSADQGLEVFAGGVIVDSGATVLAGSAVSNYLTTLRIAPSAIGQVAVSRLVGIEPSWNGTGGAASDSYTALYVNPIFGSGGVATKGSGASFTGDLHIQGSGDATNEFVGHFDGVTMDLGTGFTQTTAPTGNLWGQDLGVNGPIGLQNGLLSGTIQVVNNYYNGSPSIGPSVAIAAITKQTVGAGINATHIAANTYPVDIGMFIGGDSNAGASAIGFTTGLQVGGSVGAWHVTTSKVGTGIDIRDYATRGIYIHNPTGSPTADLETTGLAKLSSLQVGGNALTLAGAFTTSGAFGLTLTTTALTSVTLPTSGTLLTTTGSGTSLTFPGALSIASGKTLTASNTLTLTGTDSSSVAFGTGGTVTYTANNLSVFAATTSAQLAGVISDETGSGLLVFATSPSFTTPTLGVASATTINKLTLTTPATGSTFTLADGKTLTVSNTLTFTGTDSSSVAFGAGGTVTYTANNLSVFAATTSAQFFGVISDETGSGKVVGDTSPTIVTPTIASFTNATHNHQDAAGGGALSTAALTSGTLGTTRGGTGSTLTPVLTICESGTAPGATSSLTEVNLADCTIAAATINANGHIRIQSLWKLTGTNAAKTPTIRFGVNAASITDTSYTAIATGAGSLSNRYLTDIWNVNSTSSQIGIPATLAGYGASTVTPVTSSAATGSSTTYVHFNCLVGNAGDSCQLVGYSVELINP